jgi:hypothetical protein
MQMTIAGATVNITPRYAAGHVLTEGEASALNQTFIENVRNNRAKVVKELLAAGASQADIQAKVDEYVDDYQFGVRKLTDAKVSRDPVARRAISIAKAVIKAALAKKDIKVSSLPEGKFDAMVEEYAARPETVESARKALEAEAAAPGLADLDL